MAEVLKPPARRGLAAGLMLASGFAGLGYQTIWMQQCALWLGHEAAAMMAVVAAFFGGLALGSWRLAGRIERSVFPGRWYAACEGLIGLWGLVLIPLLPRAGAALQSWLGLQATAPALWVMAFASSLLLLLPATVAMGATLPAMQRILGSNEPTGGRGWAGLYAVNTAGAVAGTLLTALWLVPRWGLARSAMVCAGLNLVAAGLAWQRYGRRKVTPRSSPHAAGGTRMLALLFATGWLGIGYELMVVRVLSQVTENTVYTYTLLLGVYLAGTAAGAAAYKAWAPAEPQSDGQSTTQRLGGALALACLIGACSLWGAGRLREVITQALLGLDDTMMAALAAEAALAVVAFGPATVVMGALFSHLSRCAMGQGVDSGRCLAVNTLGGALAPPSIGVALPALGVKAGLLLLCCAYAALTWRRLSSPWNWTPMVGAAVLAWLAPPLIFVQLPEQGRVKAYREGMSSAVSVIEDSQGVDRLYINNRQQEGSSASWRVDGRQALLPLLLHPAPQQALFLGLGTGVTAATATMVPGLRLQAVELLPEVVELSPLFTDPLKGQGVDPGRLRVQTFDARRFVRVNTERFDVVVADNFHPARSGSGALYTVEHFHAVRARLADGGLFCQWLPLHQLDLQTLATIVASFRTVFPHARAVLASNSLSTPVLGLIGAAGPLTWSAESLARRLANDPLAARFGFEDPLALLGSFVAAPPALERWAAGAPLNTDDKPVVAYLAPRVTYAPDNAPADRLLALLAQFHPDGEGLLDPTSDPVWRGRLDAYMSARNRFISIGQGIEASSDPQVMLARVGEALLGVLRQSPDFRPAYDPLLRLAEAVAPTDPHAAAELLTQLARLQPARPEAWAQLRALRPAP